MTSMTKKKFNTNINYLKMNILFLFLIVSNIVLLAGLIYYYSHAKIAVDIETLDYFSTVIPTIIILGFITSKLTKLRNRGGPLYEVGCLIMITIVGLMTSYFGDRSNTAALFGPYLEMFRAL